MAEPTKLSVRSEKATPATRFFTPFDSLRREIDRMFEDFGGGFWRSPFRLPTFDLAPLGSRDVAWPTVPAIDITDADEVYEITAELPGIDEKNVEVKVANGVLTIKGEKQEEKEEKKKDYYFRERNYGSFERSFRVPDSADTDKIEANFRKGVLTVILPKKPEVHSAAKKIDVKAT